MPPNATTRRRHRGRACGTPASASRATSTGRSAFGRSALIHLSIGIRAVRRRRRRRRWHQPPSLRAAHRQRPRNARRASRSARRRAMCNPKTSRRRRSFRKRSFRRRSRRRRGSRRRRQVSSRPPLHSELRRRTARWHGSRLPRRLRCKSQGWSRRRGCRRHGHALSRPSRVTLHRLGMGCPRRRRRRRRGSRRRHPQQDSLTLTRRPTHAWERRRLWPNATLPGEPGALTAPLLDGHRPTTRGGR